MNAVVQVLLTAALVAGGLVSYHLLTRDDLTRDNLTRDNAGGELPAAPIERSGNLAKQVAALEAQEPVLRGSANAQELWERVGRLEARVGALEAPEKTTAHRLNAPPEAAAPIPVGEADSSGEASAASPHESTPLTEAQERRVRDLVSDAMSNRMRGRTTERLDRQLRELGIELSTDQRATLDQAMDERFRGMREAWREGRTIGSSREEIGEQIAQVNAQFTETLSSFMATADAEAIVAATSFGGRGGPGGGDRGRRGSRR